MIRRLDALGVFSCFGNLNGTTCDGSGYDALNRPTLKSYATPAGVSPTPTVFYCYDGKTYSGGACTGSLVAAELGQLTSAGNSVSSTDYAHDMAGRLVASTQRTAGLDDRPFTYRHFAGDAGGEVVYPSDRRVVTCPDALQRVAWVSGSKTYDQCMAGASVSASEAYASNTEYWPHGGLKQLALGNGLFEYATYNVHLQPERHRLGTSANVTAACGATTDLWCIQLGYGDTANNGNLRTQSIWSKKSSGTQLQLGQSYDYDLRNRLTTFSESVTAGGASGGNWNETNGYDRWSNRWASGTYVGTRTPRNSADIDAATNRVTQTLSGAVTYNAAGNLTAQTGWGSFTYDAENRLAASGTETYVYDGEGRRVKKMDGATTTYYVYDGAGSLMAEYGGSGSTVGGTRYLTVDHLGSTRVTTDASGAVKMRCDCAPFGEQIAAAPAQGNRNLIAEYARAEAAPTQKFTGKERGDPGSENSLDYFGARYFSGAQGRFTSPDNPKFSEKTDPQTWNLYSYVGNNPVSRIDPTGENWFNMNGSWRWHPGSDVDEKGNSCESGSTGCYHSDYTHMLLMQKTGETTADGAAVLRLTLYGNSDPAKSGPLATGTGYSGSTLLHYMTTPNGNYEINLNKRGGPETQRLAPDGTLAAFRGGIQQLGPFQIRGEWYSARDEWGDYRANLIAPYGTTPFYLHGKQLFFLTRAELTRTAVLPNPIRRS